MIIEISGFSFSESYMLDLNNNDYKNYINTWESYKPRLINNNKYFAISDDKYLFSLVFDRFIEVPKTYGLINNGKIVGIEWKDLNQENLYNKIVENNGCVIKDRCGNDGFGVYVFYIIDKCLYYKGKKVNNSELLEIISKFEQGIIQNKIEQGKFENDIFNKSINTIRVISMKKKNDVKHEVIAAIQRIGSEKSYPVDNFSQGGYTSLIDIKTGKLGKIISMCDIKDGERTFYSKHPYTNVDVEGKEIPNFKSLINQIEDITTKLPFFDFIAWDVVVKDNGFALIEINMKSTLNVFQIHKGMRNELLGQKYKEFGYLEKIK